MKVKKIGDFKKTMRELRRLRDDVPDEAAADVEKAAWAVKDFVRNTIIRQTIGTRSGDAKYEAKKEELGFGSNQLIVTGDYVKSIDVLADETSDKPVRRGAKMRKGVARWYVAPKAGRSKAIRGLRGRGASFKDLARYLEFGTNKMAPIPHWIIAEAHSKRIMRKIARKWNAKKFKWIMAGNKS